MNSRREFLLHCFRLFDERSVPYCVLRNFDEVLESAESDLDLITNDVSAILRACDDAASACGFRCVQRARFVNHTAVYWNGGDVLVRIDIDTEVRWRCWPVLTADEVLAQRTRRAEFYIVSPAHEAEIIRTQIVWMNRTTERYSRRLEELGEPATDVAAMRRAIVQRNLYRPLRWLRIARYAVRDFLRAWNRVGDPPGASLEISSARAVDAKPISAALAVLFPPSKGRLLSAGQSTTGAVFKGGLAIRLQDAPSRHITADHRAFVAVVESPDRIHIAHAGSGAMATVSALAEIPRFILEVCAREQQPVSRPGLSVALVGLDGAGKTTFARQLCSAAWARGLFPGVRYFHWIPALDGAVEFPWPHQADIPRKPPMARHGLAALLSIVRLLKNLILARVAWRWRVQPLLQRGHLVLLDRFLYNYWLDPDSVRFAAPAHWLEKLARFLPAPDVLITLQADAATLRARKQELTEAQIAEQSERLSRLPAIARRRIDLDAALPPDRLAEEALKHLSAAPP